MRGLLGMCGLVALAPGAEAIRGTINGNTNTKWAAAINSFDGKLLCAGSVISNQHILTAASCFINPANGFTNYQNRDANVIVGTNVLGDNSPRQTRYIAHIAIHPAFNPVNYAYHPADLVDLAVIRLEQHLDMGTDHTAFAAPVILLTRATAHLAVVGADLLAFSYGPSPNNGNPTRALTFATLKLTFPDVCLGPQDALYWHRATTEQRVSDFDAQYHLCLLPTAGNFLCGFDPIAIQTLKQAQLKSAPIKAGSVPLNGDFGAPLVVNQPTDFYQAGVFAGDWFETMSDRITFDTNNICSTVDKFEGRSNFDKFTSTLFFGSWIQQQTGTILPYDWTIYKGVGQGFDKTLVPPNAAKINDLLKKFLPLDRITAPNIPGGGETCTACWSSTTPANQRSSLIKNCWCDRECKQHGDCCNNYDTLCGTTAPVFQGKCSEPALDQYHCGRKVNDCWCDASCVQNNDCCSDFQASCGSSGKGKGSCVGKCGTRSGDCWCDATCQKNGDCCLDFQVCTAGSTIADPTQKRSSSCYGKCGKNAGFCWCDPGCLTNGDCCANYASSCGKPDSCAGSCGHAASTLSIDKKPCWCDPSCKQTGDCCADFELFCPSLVGLV